MKTKGKWEEIENLLAEPYASYHTDKENSVIIDQLFGFEFSDEKEQNENHKGYQTWNHLSEQAFQTPYAELVRMVEQVGLENKKKWLDCGAGYGRLGLILHLKYNFKNWHGIELVKSRADEARRIYENWGINSGLIINSDLLSCQDQIEQSDLFFVYDFGTIEQMKELLETLKNISLKKEIQIIARGKGFRSLIYKNNFWLESIMSDVNNSHWTLFSS